MADRREKEVSNMQDGRGNYWTYVTTCKERKQIKMCWMKRKENGRERLNEKNKTFERED